MRYERAGPGELLHIDVKKQGRIPDGGGKRFAPGFAETQSGPHSKRSRGLEYLHIAVDDHSRYAYVEALPDESGLTSAAFLARALEHFRLRGIWVQRVLTDNARAYRSRVFEGVAHASGLRLKRTRPTARRPTERSSASTRPCRPSGRTPASTAPIRSAWRSCPAGSTATIIGVRTAGSQGPSQPPHCHNLCENYT